MTLVLQLPVSPMRQLGGAGLRLAGEDEATSPVWVCTTPAVIDLTESSGIYGLVGTDTSFVTGGVWEGSPALSYQWQVWNGTAFEDLPGETGSVMNIAEAGTTYRLLEIPEGDRAQSVPSNEITSAGAGVFNTSPPAISPPGSASLNDSLVVQEGGWLANPPLGPGESIAFTYAWTCNGDAFDTSPSITASLQGEYRCAVTAEASPRSPGTATSDTCTVS